MIKWITFWSLCLSICCQLLYLKASVIEMPCNTQNVFAIWDEKKFTHLPENFRLGNGDYKIDDEASFVSREGLEELKISGSAQFSDKTLEGLLEEVDQSAFIMIDLRQESHGFVNGKSLSWIDSTSNKANANKNVEEIELDENRRLQTAYQEGHITVNQHTEPQMVTVIDVRTEREVIESRAFTYIRLPIQDHCHPEDEIVDQYINLVKDLADSYWFHVHCKAGKGRTTTFMTMYDMMFNSNKLSVEEIISRQERLGGSNLFKTHEPEDPKHPSAMARLDFLYLFYEYCQDVPDFSLSWTEWKTAHWH